MGKFKAALDKEKGKERIKRDMDDAAKFGARGTPTFFINGRNLRGAQPLEAFKAIIDEEIKKADAKLAAGTPRGQLYAALIKDGLDKAAAPPPPQPGRRAGRRTRASRADVKGAPSKGAKDALVTIVQFSDFQCPFCSRVEPTMDKVMEEYKGKVRVVWRDLPLPFHHNAMPAAIAARAAGEQGKFWEMHEQAVRQPAAAGPRRPREVRAGAGPQHGQVQGGAGRQQGQGRRSRPTRRRGGKIGARGTPAFFINGKFLSGAQPFEAFKAMIDEELKTAEALVAKGTPKAKVYDALMKDAKAEVPAAPAAAAGRRRARRVPRRTPRSTRCRPATRRRRGRRTRRSQVIVFSDFQCPFCTRVEPTLTQLEKEYAGQGPHGVEELPAAVPQQRRAGRPGRDGRARAGEVLADARQAVRQPARRSTAPTSRSTRRSSASTWPSSRPTSTRRSTRTPIEAEMKEGQDAGRQRHAGGVHQRAQDRGRLPVRDVQEDRRRRAGEEDRQVQKGLSRPDGRVVIDAPARPNRVARAFHV